MELNKENGVLHPEDEVYPPGCGRALVVFVLIVLLIRAVDYIIEKMGSL